jgi:hypothetical protein
VQRRLLSYEMQDLVCVKCTAVKDGNLRTSCQCSGPYRNKETEENFRTWYVHDIFVFVECCCTCDAC